MSHCVLSVNGGSSSLKYRLYRMPEEELMIARETLKLLARATNKQHAVGGDHVRA